MIRVVYKFLFLSILLFGTSCSLVRDPLDTFSDVTQGVDEKGKVIVFKDKAAVENHLVTIYRQMRDRQEHWYVDALLIGDSHSDNAYAGTTGAEVVPFENNAIEGSNSVLLRDWNRFMEDIARANLLIVNIDSVEDNALTSAERLQMKAEAKIFRALILFDMARMWGDIPVITKTAGDITSETIGEVYDDYFPAQNTELEAYQQVEADCLDAIKNAPNSNPANKTLFSKSVAKALLVKLYAEKPMRDYSKVIQYADELAAEGFDLADNYSDLFGMNAATTDIKMRNTKESILEAQFFSGSGNWATWMFGRDLTNYNNSFTWAKWITPSRDLIKTFQDEGDQIRFSESVVYYAAGWSNYYPSANYPFMFKLRSAFNSIIKLRYADILLLKAEALIQGPSQNLPAAAAIIDKVRARVNLPALSNATKASPDLMLQALLKERRLELAFEGQRWYDLVRLEKVESVMNAVYAKDSGRLKQIYPFNSSSYRLPIPQTVIDQNPKIVQNPGY
ncbi:RagB/SusD family nutrient uptake outer membrane protein [Sphingobacterium hungaricum]